MQVVVVQGKAFAEPWMKESLPAILEAWQSGQAQGLAVAETLFGLNNPAGRAAVPAPVNISMTTCQIQTGWSPRSERSFER